jgi:hypothetical protein
MEELLQYLNLISPLSIRRKSCKCRTRFSHLTEITPSGTTTRNVGFYPETSATPISPIDKGQLNNNQDHSYDISLTITMTNSQFFDVINLIPQGNNEGYSYNLCNNNCTTFSINALIPGYSGPCIPTIINSFRQQIPAS